MSALRIRLPASDWVPRGYQRPLWDYLEKGGTHAVAVWHRRAGKDEIALHRTACAAHERIGNYWHMLPEYAQARKAIWEAINPHTGRRRIDEAFPLELRKTTDNTQMKIEFKCGSIWNVVGSDNYNSLIGSPPVGLVYSEWSVANPMAHAYLSPILAENKGWALFIYTARGYNHGHATYEGAKSDPGAFAQLLTVDDTRAISPDALARQLRTYIELYGPDAGDAFFRQEMYNDWSAANIGAVIGAAIERADKSGRIEDFEIESPEVYVSSDLGFRDTCAWWFWQPKYGGFDLIDYMQGIQQDADDWADNLEATGYRFRKIYLPHDAKNKTWGAKHSGYERFLKRFGGVVEIVPVSKKADQINAARVIAERCRFHRTKCKDGLNGLRSWSFDYDEEKKIYSKEPRHDWASHPGDAFAYGAQKMSELAHVEPPPEILMKGLTVGNHPGVIPVNVNELLANQRRKRLENE